MKDLSTYIIEKRKSNGITSVNFKLIDISKEEPDESVITYSFTDTKNEDRIAKAKIYLLEFLGHYLLYKGEISYFIKDENNDFNKELGEKIIRNTSKNENSHYLFIKKILVKEKLLRK